MRCQTTLARIAAAVWIAAAVALGGCGPAVDAPALTALPASAAIPGAQILSIPVSGAPGAPPAYALSALLLLPDGAGPFPVAVINHGSPRDAADRTKERPERHVAEAREFVKRGWAVLIPARRGYGGSRESWAEGYGGCRSPDYHAPGLASARDIKGAIDYARAQPWADRARIVSVGHSAGAFGSVALSSLPVDGLAAVIAFAPGRGSQGPNTVCREDRLVDAFARYGATSRVPVLLVYAENDLFFGPSLAARMGRAFEQAGGRAMLVMAPPFGRDGHYLFSARGIPDWTPYVDAFLRAHGLPDGPP
jgi:dienelactone hydrolase